MGKALNIDDVVHIGGPLVLATAAEVDALEARFWIKLPPGYREYVQRLGEGELGGLFVRIYPPWKIQTRLVEWRRTIRTYWHWDETPDLLPKERAPECVIFGDLNGGHMLVFHPARPDRLLVLPRDGERAMEAGSNLLEAIEWMCSEPELTEPFSEREFEPYDSRIPRDEAQATVVDPEGESLDEIVELGKHWVERHSARDTCLRDVEKYAGKGTRTELILEGILLFSPRSLGDHGYVRRYAVIDDESERTLGVVELSSSHLSYCGEFYEQPSEPVRPGGPWPSSPVLAESVGNDETSEVEMMSHDDDEEHVHHRH